MSDKRRCRATDLPENVYVLTADGPGYPVGVYATREQAEAAAPGKLGGANVERWPLQGGRVLPQRRRTDRGRAESDA